MIIQEPVQAAIWHCINNYALKDATFLAERLCCEVNNDDSIFILATCYYRAKRVHDAYGLLDIKNVATPQCRLLLAQCCYDLNKNAECEKALIKCNFVELKQLDKIVDEFGDLASFALALLGKLCTKSEQHTIAQEARKRALKLNPFLWYTFVDLCNGRGVINLSNMKDGGDGLFTTPSGIGGDTSRIFNSKFTNNNQNQNNQNNNNNSQSEFCSINPNDIFQITNTDIFKTCEGTNPLSRVWCNQSTYSKFKTPLYLPRNIRKFVTKNTLKLKLLEEEAKNAKKLLVADTPSTSTTPTVSTINVLSKTTIPTATTTTTSSTSTSTTNAAASTTTTTISTNINTDTIKTEPIYDFHEFDEFEIVALKHIFLSRYCFGTRNLSYREGYEFNTDYGSIPKSSNSSTSSSSTSNINGSNFKTVSTPQGITNTTDCKTTETNPLSGTTTIATATAATTSTTVAAAASAAAAATTLTTLSNIITTQQQTTTSLTTKESIEKILRTSLDINPSVLPPPPPTSSSSPFSPSAAAAAQSTLLKTRHDKKSAKKWHPQNINDPFWGKKPPERLGSNINRGYLVEDDTQFKILTHTYKMQFVIKRDSTFHRINALKEAKASHFILAKAKAKRFDKFVGGWLKQNVTTTYYRKCIEFLMGTTAEVRQHRSSRIDCANKDKEPPYRVFSKYKS